MIRNGAHPAPHLINRVYQKKAKLTKESIKICEDMIERSGDYTHIRFINKSLNEEIPEHIFDLH